MCSPALTVRTKSHSLKKKLSFWLPQLLGTSHLSVKGDLGEWPVHGGGRINLVLQSSI